MTFEEFQKTRREAFLDEDGREESHKSNIKSSPGHLYAGGLWLLVREIPWGDRPGKYWLCLLNEDWLEEGPSGLASLERKLYEFGKVERAF